MESTPDDGVSAIDVFVDSMRLWFRWAAVVTVIAFGGTIAFLGMQEPADDRCAATLAVPPPALATEPEGWSVEASWTGFVCVYDMPDGTTVRVRARDLPR